MKYYALIAGMPVPLPFVTETFQGLSGSFAAQLQVLSFFCLGFLFSVVLVRFLWNAARKDLPFLPRLSLTGAFATTALWGLLFVIVLTMISGARELMTPGAWEKKGVTYQLVSKESDQLHPLQIARKEHLEKLQRKLWQYAATHEGKFPSPAENSLITSNDWKVPDARDMRYSVVSGRKANSSEELLLYEPELEFSTRWVLLTNGEIVLLSSSEIEQKLGGE